jgi:(2Fe-2S) ferredoxin
LSEASRLNRTGVGVCSLEPVFEKMLTGVKYGSVKRNDTTALAKMRFRAREAAGDTGIRCALFGARRLR